MGSRIDTPVAMNVTSALGSGIRATTGRHIGWITTTPTGFSVNYDSHATTNYSLAAHAGWSFTSARMHSHATLNAVATLVFAEHHDETTRQYVMRWLDRKYSIDYYS